MSQGLFLTVEGIEGVGKSTAVHYIHDYLKKSGIDALLTREPGGTDIAEQIREVLLANNDSEPMAAETELLLMYAGRAQHIAHFIRPALAQDKWVVCDRFSDASFAYQGGGRGIDIHRIKQLDDWVLQGLKPNLTILLDAPVELGMKRVQNRGASDRIEKEKFDFFERIRRAYLDLASQYPNRFRIVDASNAISDVQNELSTILDQAREAIK